MNDTLVKTRQSAQEVEMRRDRENRDLVRATAESSYSLAGRAAGRLGDGLIRLGHKLKDGDKASPSSIERIFDFD